MAAVEISSTTTSCYERAFDDLAGERLLNLEFEMLKHYEITYFKKLWNPLILSLQEIKYLVSFNVQMFSETLKTEHLQLFTNELCLYRSIPIALFVKILQLLNHRQPLCSFALKDTMAVNIKLFHIQRTEISYLSSN